MRYILTILTSFITLVVGAQKLEKNNINYSNPAFAAGEKLTYVVSYKAAMFNTNIASVIFMVSDSDHKSKPTYKLTADAKVYPFYRWFFDLHDQYHVWLEKECLRPLYFKNEIREGSYRFRSSYDFRWDEMKVYTKARNLKRPNDTSRSFQIAAYNYDALSIFYNLRSTKINNLVPGWFSELCVVFADTVRKVRYTFIGYEVREIPLGKFKTMKFSCQLANSDGNSFPEGSEFYVWFSDDRNRIPLYVESPVRVGKVRATLDNFSGLKFPLDSKIN